MERPPTPSPDPLPTNKPELEGLRNFHVSQLETLAKRVKLFNEHVDIDSIVLSHLQQEDKSKMAATVMQKRVNSELRCKRDMEMSVSYHREELKKVLKALMKDKVGDMKDGEDEDVLPIINGLPTPGEWRELFKD
ncbi:MAG: hypothetical protein M1830_000738 [Pleopsidium flavum]|nr:MAG: hypothetical protein M1830_000743 [Pleopsidium flavum]KAI9873186.1 MAG: hypothetical protein M1830_000738 [Pleopsidium flavum]